MVAMANMVNPNASAYQLGGLVYNPKTGQVEGGQSAQNMANRYQGMGGSIAQQMGNEASGSYNAGQYFSSQGNNARTSQTDALGLMASAAQGNQPSAAQIQQQQGLDAAMKSQQALAASARGPGALAAAQGQAASNTAQLQQQAAAQGSQLRAQEMAQARGDYMAGATGIRGQDITAANNANTLGLGQQTLGFNTQKGYEDLGFNTYTNQLNANMAQQGLFSQNYNTAQGQNLGFDEAAMGANAQTSGNMLSGGLGMTGSGLSTIAMMGALA